MEAKTFILSNPRTYSRGVRVFIKGKDGKFTDRLLPFTTAHKTKPDQRTKGARTIHAEYTTSNEVEIEALYRDSAYGKTFYEVGDKKGKNKLPTLIVTKEDAEMVSLEGLFAAYELPFNKNLPIDVLKRQYQIHIEALAGTKKIGTSTATEIPHVPANPKADITASAEAARNAYEEKYGEPVPDIVKNDLAFLDGLSNPEFDAAAYIAEKEAGQKDGEKTEEITSEAVNEAEKSTAPTKEELQVQYQKKFGVNVPNAKKNDVAWIKAKLSE